MSTDPLLFRQHQSHQKAMSGKRLGAMTERRSHKSFRFILSTLGIKYTSSIHLSSKYSKISIKHMHVITRSLIFTPIIVLSTSLAHLESIAFAKNKVKVCPTLLQASKNFSSNSVKELERKMRDYGYIGSPIANAFRVGNHGVAIWMKEGSPYDVVIEFNNNQTILHYNVILQRRIDESLIKSLKDYRASSYEVRCLAELKESGGENGSW